MNYEQKYKEALEWMRSIYPTMQGAEKEDAEHYFPELRESEDERIRKAIICGMNALKEQHKETFASIPINDCIAWLEKQGEQKLVEQDTEIHDLWVYIREWNDKFGRLPKDEDELAACIDYVMKRQKPTDKIEPKFKVGDWIVYNRDDYSKEIIQVYDIRDGRYYFTDNIHFSWSIKECDEKCHLWTIQDANDGDVLATKKGNPFIYDKDRYNNRLAYYYAGLDVNKELTLKSPHHMLAHFGELSGVFPATKEQCDLLFSKMKEAGYEWDIEKKELRKIETSTWSEEDEKLYTSALWHIKNSCGNGGNDSGEYEVYNWLKSIKDRVQPKQELSKEDEHCIELLLPIIDSSSLIPKNRKKCKEFLKSLKSGHWKPSEEQMKALNAINIFGELSYVGQGGTLVKLYNDLKNL